jgi:hypothetical protein
LSLIPQKYYFNINIANIFSFLFGVTNPFSLVLYGRKREVMIELVYFLEEQNGTPAYQVIQFNPGEPWQIVDGDEIIGRIQKQEGLWSLNALSNVPEGLLTGIAKLIEQQDFNRLPSKIKEHWATYVQEVIAQNDALYLIVCKDNIDFDRFKKLFWGYIGELIKDPWEIRFRVYNSDMSDDFEVVVN